MPQNYEVLSERVSSLSNRFERHMEKEEESMKIQSELIREIRAEQAKMKGFWGGVVFVFSSIGVAAGLAVSYMGGK